MRKFVKVEEIDTIKPFGCGDKSLDDFLFEDARYFYDEFIANTFYEKNGFRLLQSEIPEDADTILMYFDLKAFSVK